MADSVAELLFWQRLAILYPDGYMAFGEKRKASIWAVFSKETNPVTAPVTIEWLA